MPSTAAFDKNPQSKERGITLDLGEYQLRFLVSKIDLQILPVNKFLAMMLSSYRIFSI